ncbi:signal transduction histidine kinase [Herbaspirillum sp. 1173]|uniref:ATP-binding protein n=1 Tax=Herbaspirillum sp. 1173 TaxID=2817734 RepID=UPI0028647C16|nr:ATP-binding protein [Herbaspirillum sp. 1173]MDR6739154.1 signal transduction histidine kinase [Herbaspirillum sp. 1173]
MQTAPPGDAIEWPRLLVASVISGILYYLVASPAANVAESTTLAAIAWPAPALLIALLWHKPLREWAPHLLAVFVAMMFVGDKDSLPMSIDAGFALLNVVEIAVCTLIGRRFVARDGQIDTVRRLMRFLLMLPLGVMCFVAAMGATLVVEGMGGHWWAEWQTLLVGNGLPILVLVPAFLSWTRPQRGPTGAEGGHVGWASFLAMLVVVSALLASVSFDFSEEVLRVLMSLALAGAALYGGMRSATAAMSAAAVLAVLLTLHDLGPYRQDGLDSTWRLQIDLMGLAVLAFFVAVAVRERQALTARMETMRRFESLGLMAGGIAHDFNNVLGAVGGYAEMAHERVPVQSPARKPLEEVMSAVSRGRDLTEQILLAARRGDRHRAPLDLRAPVEEAVRLARPLCRAGVVIEFTPPAQPLVVKAHAGQITRVALNLARNASQAARSKVVVSLQAGEAPDTDLRVGDVPADQAVWLEVADDGTGIAPEHMSRLFDPFFSTRTGPGGKGTGLGLAIVAGIATEHDGGVAVSSSEAGTRFRLLLPMDAGLRLPAQDTISAGPTTAQDQPVPGEATEERTTERAEEGEEPVDVSDAPVLTALSASPALLESSASSESSEPLAPLGMGELVFVVDDDQAVRELSEDRLAGMGFEPVGFADPLEALAELAREPDALHLLVTDFDMPQMKGDALITQARALRADLPVLLCSGERDTSEIAARLGVPALAKPFDQAALRRAIMAALDADHQGKEQES